MFLKVSPFRGIRRFGVHGKLSSRFIGPFEILELVGPVAYRVALPLQLAGTHDVFHVSALRKYVFDPAYMIDFTPLELGEDLSYECHAPGVNQNRRAHGISYVHKAQKPAQI